MTKSTGGYRIGTIKHGKVQHYIMATTKTGYRRASEFIKGLGENLDKIAGTDMLLHEFEIERDRQYGDGTNDLVIMTLSTLDDEENKQKFHAWSGSLADRLEEMQGATNAALPLIVAFKKAKTSRGFNVWTVE